jgi:hypothetical protein
VRRSEGMGFGVVNLAFTEGRSAGLGIETALGILSALSGRGERTLH